MNYDDINQINPFTAIRNNGGGNGEDDVAFKRILKTERYNIYLPHCDGMPEKHRTVAVIERLFLENYDNIFLSWTARMADGSYQNPFKFVGTHETTHGVRREPDGTIGSQTYRIADEVFLKFRDSAKLMLARAQKEALCPSKPRRNPSYEPTVKSMNHLLDVKGN